MYHFDEPSISRVPIFRNTLSKTLYIFIRIYSVVGVGTVFLKQFKIHVFFLYFN